MQFPANELDDNSSGTHFNMIERNLLGSSCNDAAMNYQQVINRMIFKVVPSRYYELPSSEVQYCILLMFCLLLPSFLIYIGQTEGFTRMIH